MPQEYRNIGTVTMILDAELLDLNNIRRPTYLRIAQFLSFIFIQTLFRQYFTGHRCTVQLKAEQTCCTATCSAHSAKIHVSQLCCYHHAFVALVLSLHHSFVGHPRIHRLHITSTKSALNSSSSEAAGNSPHFMKSEN